jgi:hypothetical protein
VITLVEFSDWLSMTPPSQMMQDVSWATPAVQSVHIVALATVFFLMAAFDLEVMGILPRPVAPNWARRSLPWLWGGLGVLLVTGLMLVIGEPKRELLSWPFRIKMLLIVLAALLTVVLSRLAAKPTPTVGTRLIAGLVLICWVLIIVCGRWIAYYNFGQDNG